MFGKIEQMPFESPDCSKSEVKSASFLGVENKTIDFSTISDAANNACRFFGIEPLPLKEGKETGVALKNLDNVGDEYFIYNPRQFEYMGWDDFYDQTKVWTHEVGHIISQKEFPEEPWKSELAADFFVGVRSEMCSWGSGDFEASISKTTSSASHPGGALRLEAINYGRQVAAQIKSNGITPTWQSCMDEFKKSKFANVEVSENFKGINDREWNLKQAEHFKKEAEYYEKECKKAIEKNNPGLAADYEHKAKQEMGKYKDYIWAANHSTK